MKLFLGVNGRTYRNTGTYGSPTWTEIKNVKDLGLNIEHEEYDASTREGGGWEGIVSALIRASIEYQMRYDTTDANWIAIRDAALSIGDANVIEFAIMDGPIGTTGSQGLRASFSILKFPRSENLAEHMMVDVAMKPAPSANAPAWYTVP